MDRRHTFIAIILISMMCSGMLSEMVLSGIYCNISPQTEKDPDDFLPSKINNAILGFFYENLGQVDNPDIRFIGQTTSGIIGFSENQISFKSRDSNSSFTLTFQSLYKVTPRAEDESAHTTNFIHGDDVRFTGIRGYSTIVYNDVWSGITIICTSTQSGIVFGFQISSSSDPTSISIKTSQHESLSISDESITIRNDQIDTILDNLKAYQGLAKIPANFIELETDLFGIEIDSGSSQSPITVESILRSTSLGGSDFDVPYSLVLDDFGYAYVTGYTVSSDFLVENPLDSSFNGESDCFVFKIHLDDNSIQYSTFIGGSDRDIGTGIAIDEEGNAYVTGRTQSSNFPMSNGYDSSFNGGIFDCFVLKLNSAGNSLVYSSFIGGSANDYGEAIVVDSFGVVSVTGYTSSSDFPTINGFDLTFNGGFSDTFVFKLDPSSENLVYSTLVGGSNTDIAASICMDSFGCVYVAGYTYSVDFPILSAIDYTYNDYRDSIVYKLSENGNQLIYSTYLGGEWIDQAEAIAVDAYGNAFVTGTTYSYDFPTINAYDDSQNGGSDCFVSIIGPFGNELLSSTFLGGSENDFGCSLSLDSHGFAYVSGDTESQDFPTVNADSSTMNGTSGTFVTKFSSSFDTLLYSTFLGGYLEKSIQSIAVDSYGTAFISGYRRINVTEYTLLGSVLVLSNDIFVMSLIDLGDSDLDDLADYLENNLNLNRFSSDTDMDGFSDAWELNFLGTDPTNNDTDFDNLSDFQEVQVFYTNPLLADSDSDKLSDSLEVSLGTNPNAADSDFDTIDDYDEVNVYGTNPLSSDSDMDTISDADEIGLHGTNPLSNDTDIDEMLDQWEILYGLDPLFDDSLGDLDSDTLLNIEEKLYGTLPNNNDTDSDDINDAQEIKVYKTNPLQRDSDFDTLNDFEEIFNYGTNATNSDSDFDKMPDNWEIFYGLDALVNDSASDPDFDSLMNLDEYLNGANPNLNDTDFDLLDDFEEVFTYGTSPNKSDSDSDTLSDYSEIMVHTTNPLSKDTDLDNLSDSLEILTYFTNPLLKDTDLDLMFDGWEVLYSLNPLVNDTADDADIDQLTNLMEYLLGTNPQNSDTDFDFLDDFAELNDFNTNPLSNDSDSDLVFDYDEIFIYSTNPNSDDSDNDTMFDGWEIQFGLDPNINDTLGDLDADGLINLLEFIYGANPLSNDTDFDTLDDYYEVFVLGTSPSTDDSDFDTMPDLWELTYGLDPTTNDGFGDLDSDGLLNAAEYDNQANPLLPDSDFDGLSDLEEATIYFSKAYLSDSDNDSISDFDEVMTFFTNPNSNDTDFDCIPDSWEIKMSLNPLWDDSTDDYDSDDLTNFEEFEGNTNPYLSDSDYDDLSDFDELKVHLTDPNSEDSDQDGLSDFTEVITYFTNPWSSDSDSDLLPDSWEIAMGLHPLLISTYQDQDSDGLTNIQEYQYESNPLLIDSDSDGLTDPQEIFIYGTNPSSSDSDFDKLSDSDEILKYKTNPLSSDTDADLIRDKAELDVYYTNPLLADTDYDSMTDGWEIRHNLNPLLDDSAADPDNDGFSNSVEFSMGTNPQLKDTDFDDIDDFTEVSTYHTSPIRADSDFDGTPDGWEIHYGFDPLLSDSHTDSDFDGLTELQEFQYGSSPFSSDTDSDALSDMLEALIYFTNPASSDSDFDELSDFEEIMTYGTNPLSADSDDDGMPDLWEVTFGLNATKNNADIDEDSDNLTNLMEYNHKTNPNLSDSDFDEINDFLEVNIYGTNPSSSDSDSDTLSDFFELFSSFSDPNQNDTDHDKLLDALEIEIGTNPNSSDTDSDSIPDYWEYSNGYDPVNANVPIQELLHYNAVLILLLVILFSLVLFYSNRRFGLLTKLHTQTVS